MLNNANINNNIGNNGHNTSIDNAGGNGYMPYPKDGFDVPRQDSGYSSQTQLPPAPNPYHAYYNPTDGHGMQAGAPGYGYSNDNGLVRRKESTSFEHEHPAPVSMPRYCNLVWLSKLLAGFHKKLRSIFESFI
jgi:hypothetical protein